MSDLIDRQAVIDALYDWSNHSMTDAETWHIRQVIGDIKSMPSAQPKTGHCKDCKYFEYDSVLKAGGIPLIVAHEICKKWGDGCKTDENGYCFLFEPQESEEV